MRKLLLLLLLAVGVWAGARYFAQRGEVKATIVFTHAAGLRRGDPVVEQNVVVGRVSSLGRVDDRDAVTVRLSRDHRRAIVTDSLFAIANHRLVVSNTFAIGKPVANGEILVAPDDKVSRWMAKHGSTVQPYIDKLKARSDAAIDSAAKPHPAVTAKVSHAARKLKDRVERWLDDLHSD